MVALAALYLCGESEAAAMTAGAGATQRLAVMESIGLRGVQEDVEKSIWESNEASDAADVEDAELAALMGELDELDDERDAAEAEAKKQEIAAKEAQAAALKAAAAQKAAEAEAAIKRKAKEVEEVAAAAQKQAEDMIANTKDLRSAAAAAMEEAKLASAEYQSALSSGQGDGLAALETHAKQALAKAEKMSEEAGDKSKLAKQALENASQVKAKADKSLEMENESTDQLKQSRLVWAAGPIFDKMKRLCDIDYPEFQRMYRKLRESPVYSQFRFDIKKACHKARDDDLENWKPPEKEDEHPVGAHVDPSMPYPDKNRHWNIPEDKKVKKWCSTKFGAVPCTMLKKAKEAGLLGEDTTKPAKADSMDVEELFEDDEGLEDPLDQAPDLEDVISFKEY
jgi:hypothetical protein